LSNRRNAEINTLINHP